MGRTTPSAAATATAASKALPPRWRTESPTKAATGWAEATMPRTPIASGRRSAGRPATGSRRQAPSSTRAAASLMGSILPAIGGRVDGARGTLLRDLQQLDLEDERGPGLDPGRRAAVAVGEVGRADEPTLPADLHQLEALLPARDDPVQLKRRGLAALDRAVEHRAVGQRAVIMDLDRIAGLRGRSRPRLDRDDHQAGGGLRRAGLGGGLGEERLARLLLRGGGGRRARLLKLLDLRAVRLEVDLRLLLEGAVGEAGLHDLDLGLAERERPQVAGDRDAEGVERLLLVRLQLRCSGRARARGQDEAGEEEADEGGHAGEAPGGPDDPRDPHASHPLLEGCLGVGGDAGRQPRCYHEIPDKSGLHAYNGTTCRAILECALIRGALRPGAKAPRRPATHRGMALRSSPALRPPARSVISSPISSRSGSTTGSRTSWSPPGAPSRSWPARGPSRATFSEPSSSASSCPGSCPP